MYLLRSRMPQDAAEVPGHARHADGVGPRPDGAGLDGDGEAVPVPWPGGGRATPLHPRGRRHQRALHRRVRLNRNSVKVGNVEVLVY